MNHIKQADQKFDLVTDFVSELLVELGVTADNPKYAELSNILEERVTSRVFLDIIKNLTPEQAALVAEDIKSNKPDADKILGELLDQAPHLQTTIAASLGKIHTEIKNDFTKLVA